MLRLELTDITKQYPGVLANDRVSLRVKPGEIHAVLGENGAGKSTLMKIIYGAVLPDAGQVRWNGEAVAIGSPHEARQLGISMVFQHFSLFDTLTAAENVWLGLGKSVSLASVTQRIAQVAFALARLVAEQVFLAGLVALELAGGGHAEALARGLMALHLGHGCTVGPCPGGERRLAGPRRGPPGGMPGATLDVGVVPPGGTAPGAPGAPPGLANPGTSSGLTCAAARFSRRIASYTSLRWTAIDLGALIPNRTLSPRMSTTVTSMSSPIMIVSSR